MEVSSEIKQVILIRKDLKMRRGKEIAQGAHAAMEFLIDRVRERALTGLVKVKLRAVEAQWIARGTAKVCLQVNSEEELLECHRKALDSGLCSYLIQDAGRTEFHGEPTFTACAIGPDEAGKIDPITGSLVLY